MQLRLTLLSTSLRDSCNGNMFVDELRGITIGRSDDSDLVLMDETLHVSAHHASIYFQNGQFYLTDTSTNGTFLNDVPERVEKGSSALLRQNDHIKIGQYEFAVQIINSDNQANAAKPCSNNISPARADDQLFGGLEGLLNTSRSVPLSPASDLSNISSDEQESNDSSHSELCDDWLNGDDSPPPAAHLDKSVEQPDLSSASSRPGMADTKDLSIPESVPDVQLESSLNDGSASSECWNSFVKELGVGIDEHDSQIAASLGCVMKELLAGVIELVRLRENIKNEYRLQRTQIKPSNNNPFKFATTTEELIKAISGNDQDAYILGSDAVREITKDIVLHEMAVMTAMQKTIESMLMKLSPDVIEALTKNENASLLSKINIKSRCWDNFNKMHTMLLKSDSEDLIQKVNLTFIQQYEAEIDRLKEK